MSKTAKITVPAVIAVCLAILFMLGGCDSGRDYKEDIHVSLEGMNAEIIIREWSWLLGSGEEVYYKADGKKKTLLGRLSGGDNGYCPFEDGKYSVSVEDGKLTVEWCAIPHNDTWRKEVFDLPS